MNPFALLAILACFAAFACLLWAFAVRMKPRARRARIAVYVTSALALALFLLYGFMRNFF